MKDDQCSKPGLPKNNRMAEGFEQCTSNAMNIPLGMGMAIYYLFMFKFIQIWDGFIIGFTAVFSYRTSDVSSRTMPLPICLGCEPG
jgi:hypothetical protein